MVEEHINNSKRYDSMKVFKAKHSVGTNHFNFRYNDASFSKVDVNL